MGGRRRTVVHNFKLDRKRPDPARATAKTLLPQLLHPCLQSTAWPAPGTSVYPVDKHRARRCNSSTPAGGRAGGRPAGRIDKHIFEHGHTQVGDRLQSHTPVRHAHPPDTTPPSVWHSTPLLLGHQPSVELDR